VIPRCIAFLNPVAELGGGEQSLLRILRVLNRHSPATQCYLLVGGDGPLIEAARNAGAIVEQFPLGSSTARLGDSGGKLQSLARLAIAAPRSMISARNTLGWLRTWFNSTEPDLIHSNGMKTHLLSAWSRPDAVPLIWHIRDFPSQRPLMRRLLRHAGRRATLAIANSDAVATDARSVFPHPLVTTLHNMVDTEAFTPQGEAVDLDRLAGLPAAEPSTVRIGLVATYAHWKGHDVLLRAVAQLNTTGKHRLYLVGGPIYATVGSQFSREELTKLVHSLGLQDRVGFVPFQVATPPVYRALDLVVHASTRPEPFGLCIVEAMACGRAVIVAAGGGAAELFTDGIDALGHEPGNIDSLTRALDRLLSDDFLRQRLGTRARQTAVQRFSEGPFAKNLLGIYERCLTPSAV